MGDSTRFDSAQHERALERIEAAARSARAASVGNPRYFATMFAGCFTCTEADELHALEALADAAEVILKATKRRRAADDLAFAQRQAAALGL